MVRIDETQLSCTYSIHAISIARDGFKVILNQDARIEWRYRGTGFLLQAEYGVDNILYHTGFL